MENIEWEPYIDELRQGNEDELEILTVGHYIT